MNLPDRETAHQILAEAEARNPGPWAAHSRCAAQAAAILAGDHPQLDPEAAYVLGLLHDIGRREGVTAMRHILDGYRYLEDLGYSAAARISLTHSYPIADLKCAAGLWDASEAEAQFVQDYLLRTPYDAYDHLIQLCDALSLPDGFCLIEKRIVDVALRYGVGPCSVARWQRYFEIQAEFERAIGHSIYAHLPGVVENTFAVLPNTGQAASFQRPRGDGPSTPNP